MADATSLPRPGARLRGFPLDGPGDGRHVFFAFDGRIGRAAWWVWGVGAMLGLSALITALLQIAGLHAMTASGIANLLLVWPAAAITTKRWHDRDKSAWWLLVAFVPVIGTAWTVIECGLLRGTPAANRYGAPPP